MDDLNLARNIAARIRLSEDIAGSSFEAQGFSGREQHKDSMLRNGLLISASVTPNLEDRLTEVCNRLHIPRSCVTAFVFSSPQIQADCLVDSDSTCVLRFTSGLVNLMDDKEFQFVAAHELGHFLLGHGACSQYRGDGSTEGYMIQRAGELSADRIGYLGVDSLDESIQSIIKAVSGLDERFLRFDVSSFLGQAGMLSSPGKGESRNSTHPSMLIRCRALMWFSMVVKSMDDLEKLSELEIKRIDKKVTTDLEKYVDGQVRARKGELEQDIALWKACVLILHQGSFRKDVQERMKQSLGLENLNGLKSFFDMFEAGELLTEANSRLKASLESAYQEYPRSASDIEEAGFRCAYSIAPSE